MANRHNITFNTTAEYNTFKASANYVEPNVSYVTENNTVHYNPYVDPYAGHAYVDLGLPSGTKWATMNVGASSETDYGNYYMYGKGSRVYNSSDSIYEGTEDPLDSSVDTAAQVWGGSWHMPTKAQMQELTTNTTYQWTTINGVNGGKFTATNGNYVFFPAAGAWNRGSQFDVGDKGNCWGSSPIGSDDACFLSFNYSYEDVNNDYRMRGYSVRPVVG